MVTTNPRCDVCFRLISDGHDPACPKTQRTRLQAHAEEQAHRKALVEEARERVERERKAVGVAIDQLLRTDEGQVFFEWLFGYCGYNEACAEKQNGFLVPHSVEHNDAVRSVYIAVRERASLELIHAVELAAEKRARGESNA